MIPRVGDIIEHTDEHGTHKGEVQWVGSAQFSYYADTTVVKYPNGDTHKGVVRQCLKTKGDWKIVKRKPTTRREVLKKIREKKQRGSNVVSNRKKRRSKTAGSAA